MTSVAAASEPRQRAGSANGTLVLACIAQFMVILDVSVVNVALPAIRSDLHFTETSLQWVVNAYTLTFAGFLLLGGRAADLLGRRRVFIGGLLLFSLASLVGGLSQGQGMLVAARAAQGLGGAIVSPATLAIITTAFHEGPERNRALGYWGAMGAAGGTFGVLVGGMLTDLLSWQWILFINVPIGLVTAALAPRYVAEGRDDTGSRHFDLAGAVTITLGLVAIVYAIVRTDVYGWGSARTIGALGAGLALVAMFLVIEGSFAPRPLMPLGIFRSRQLSGANGVVLLLGAAMFGMWFFVSLYLQQVLGLSPLKAGLCFLPMTAMIAIGSTGGSRLVARVGPRPLLVTGLLLQVVGLLLFARVSVHGSFASDTLLPGILVASGIGLSFVPATITAVAGVARRDAGLASGLVNTSRLLGGALGLAVLATVATSRTQALLAGHHQTVQYALTAGFHRAFVVAAGFALVGALIALVALRKPGTRPAGERSGQPALETSG
jgi:EmrB/QacA subfamily drug resistance transporter